MNLSFKYFMRKITKRERKMLIRKGELPGKKHKPHIMPGFENFALYGYKAKKFTQTIETRK